MSMYICFEGTVGTGKTTQSKILYDYLQKKYPDREVIRVREPGKTPIAEAIRTLVQGTIFDEEMDPLCEAYLYTAARAQLINTVIKPILEKGGIVISDRCFRSSLSYQGYAKGLGIDKVRQVNAPIVGDCLPDHVLFFDMPVDIGLSRTFDSAGDKHELNGKDFFLKAHEGYLACIKDGRFAKHAHSIDALGSIEEVTEKMLHTLPNIL